MGSYALPSDEPNRLVYRARALQTVDPESEDGDDDDDVHPAKRRGLSMRLKAFLMLQLLVVLALIALGVRKLRHPPLVLPTTISGDKELFFWDDGIGAPSRGCWSSMKRRARYVTAFTRALDAFREYAPVAVLNASDDFRDWRAYINSSKRRRQQWENFTKLSFGNFGPGTTIVDLNPPRRQSFLTYLRVWKSGNDAIRMNLIAAAGNASDVTGTVRTSSKRRRHGNRNTDFVRDSFLKLTKVFTFVRDPVDHFAAAYRELEFRWMHEFNNGTYSNWVREYCDERTCVFHTFPVGSADRAWAFLGDLMLGKLALLREVQHVYPQSGILSEGFPLDFVGRLERFEEDWQHVIDTYVPRASGYQFDHSLGAHNSSKFDEGLAAKELVRAHDVGFIRVLEELLVLDFLCFGYELEVPIEEETDEEE